MNYAKAVSKVMFQENTFYSKEKGRIPDPEHSQVMLFPFVLIRTVFVKKQDMLVFTAVLTIVKIWVVCKHKVIAHSFIKYSLFHIFPQASNLTVE